MKRERLKKFLFVLGLLLMFSFLTGAIRWDTTVANIETKTVTGAAALSTSLAPGKAFKLLEVRLHLSSASATSENLTATMDAGAGEAYDTVLLAKDMNTVANYIYTFEDRYFGDSDEIDFAWANTNTRTYGLEIVYQTFR